MIIPKEKPYMDGLNSYYIVVENFVEHLQGEIGSGCIYFKSSTKELLVYFDEMDILCGVIQGSGEHAQVAPNLQPIFDTLKTRNFLVKVFHLDPHAIFYWAQMPAYQREKNEISSSDISLDKLVEQLADKKASCFVDVKFTSANLNSIIFFNEGNFVGASYSWGAGGLNPSKQEFETFLKAAADKKGTFSVGHFTQDSSIRSEPEKHDQHYQEEKQEQIKTPELSGEDQVFISNLPTALEEFLDMYTQTLKKKAHVDPISLMQQRIIVRGDDYPFMDPFNPPFDYSNGEFIFTGTDNAFGENTAKAIIACSWDVVKEHRQEKKFATALEKWEFRTTLEERGYTVIE